MENKLRKIHEETKIEIKPSYKNEEYPKSWIKIYYKNYPRFKKIKLPKPKKISKQLYEVILSRSSIRNFNKKSITIREISEILYYSCGITNYHNSKSIDETKRSYPSAGGRYPIEIYLAIFKCEGIKPGIYYYNVKGHYLELMIPGNHMNKINGVTYQDMIIKSSITFLLTGVFSRTQVKYGTRAYRYILLDLGHMAQNIYLVSTNLQIGCCTIGGFSDEKINNFLDLDKSEQVLYMGVLGKYDKN